MANPLHMFAMAAAGIAIAMKTNSVPLSTSAQNSLLTQGILGFAAVLQKVFLPHLIAGMGLFLLAAYTSYLLLLKPLHLPSPLDVALAGTIFSVYSLAAFAYSMLAACAFAVRSACIAWEDFIDSTLDLIKENLAIRIEDMNEGLAKKQAKILVSGSVRDVFSQLRKQESKRFPRWMAATFLGVVTLALRSVLIAKIVKFSGTTVKLGKLFAGKASLAGAVFLNLRLFSTLLLIVIYTVGIVGLLLNFTFVFWLK